MIFPAKGPPCPLPHICHCYISYINISLLHPRWDEQCRDTMMTVPPQLTSSLPSFSYPASFRHPPPASSCTTLGYTTPHYTTLDCTALQVQVQLQLHYNCNYTCNYDYNCNYTTLQVGRQIDRGRDRETQREGDRESYRERESETQSFNHLSIHQSVHPAIHHNNSLLL